MSDLELPDGLEHVRTTPVLDETTTPAGLRDAHRLASGVWGRLVVHSGELAFAFDDEPQKLWPVEAGQVQVIPPQRMHHVVIDGPVEFAVEFHRDDRL